jgi:hypothetical protein
MVLDTETQEVIAQSQALKEECCGRREGSEVVEVVLASYSTLASQNETIADLLKSLVANESSLAFLCLVLFPMPDANFIVLGLICTASDEQSLTFAPCLFLQTPLFTTLLVQPSDEQRSTSASCVMQTPLFTIRLLQPSSLQHRFLSWQSLHIFIL